MESIEGNKLIVKLQKDLAKNGMKKLDGIIDGLKELRPFALEEQDPTLTKVIRLTYEHLEANNTFNIPLPADEAITETEGDEEAEVELIQNEIESDEDRVESLDYLLSLMLDRNNPTNRQEMFEYRDALKAY
ncbi:MAG: hypothetical protein KDD41_02275 [Flavobacteriales bacterium]|nr:hypothetical protein [Flavobacteriales bacterium]